MKALPHLAATAMDRRMLMDCPMLYAESILLLPFQMVNKMYLVGQIGVEHHLPPLLSVVSVRISWPRAGLPPTPLLASQRAKSAAPKSFSGPVQMFPVCLPMLFVCSNVLAHNSSETQWRDACLHHIYYILVNFYPGTSFCIVLGARNLDASLFGVYNTLK